MEWVNESWPDWLWRYEMPIGANPCLLTFFPNHHSTHRAASPSNLCYLLPITNKNSTTEQDTSTASSHRPPADRASTKPKSDGALAHELLAEVFATQARVHPQSSRCWSIVTTQYQRLDKVVKQTCRTVLDPPHTTYHNTNSNWLTTLLLEKI